MTWIEALVLGLLQGLTEFLPVSSSGHIEIGKALFEIQSHDNLIFSVVVHAATMLSILVVFRGEIVQLVGGILKFKWNGETRYLALILVSMIPVGIAGFFFEDRIDSFFEGRLVLVGAMLFVTSMLLFSTRYSHRQAGQLGYWQALIIGFAQTIAILPGISRSGATISTALLLGIDRKTATRFSFLMVLPPIAGATLLKMKDVADSPGTYSADILPLSLGFAAAFVMGLLACQWMIRLVQKGNISWFSVYCAIAGVVAIVVGTAR